MPLPLLHRSMLILLYPYAQVFPCTAGCPQEVHAQGLQNPPSYPVASQRPHHRLGWHHGSLIILFTNAGHGLGEIKTIFPHPATPHTLHQKYEGS